MRKWYSLSCHNDIYSSNKGIHIDLYIYSKYRPYLYIYSKYRPYFYIYSTYKAFPSSMQSEQSNKIWKFFYLLESSIFYLFRSSIFYLFGSSIFYLFGSSIFYLFGSSIFYLFGSSIFYLFGSSIFYLFGSRTLQFIPAPTSPWLVRKHFLLANKSMLLARLIKIQICTI